MIEAHLSQSHPGTSVPALLLEAIILYVLVEQIFIWIWAITLIHVVSAKPLLEAGELVSHSSFLCTGLLGEQVFQLELVPGADDFEVITE